MTSFHHPLQHTPAANQLCREICAPITPETDVAATRYPDPVFPAKLLLFGNRTCPRIPFDRTTRKGFSTNSTRTGLAPAPARCSFQRWLTVFVTVFLFLTCFYEAGMRVHSDAIDYKTNCGIVKREWEGDFS